MDDNARDQADRTLAATTPRRVATGALALGGLAALAGLGAQTGSARKKAHVSPEKKKKRGPAGPTGPTGPAGVGGGATGPTGPTGATGPASGAILGTQGVTKNETLTAGETKEATAVCPPATATEEFRATGGGFEVNAAEVQILASRQTLDGLGWRVRATNTSAISQVLTSWLVCVRYSK